MHFVGSDYSLNEDAKQFLMSNTWQGNVRELENACKRAMVFATEKNITRNDFDNLQKNKPIQNEKQQIENALVKHSGVIKHTANELGYSRQALYRRIEKYKIDVNSLC